MKNIILSSVAALALLSTAAVAEEKKSPLELPDDVQRVEFEISTGVDWITIDEPTSGSGKQAGEIVTDPIPSLSFRAGLNLTENIGLSFEYKRTIEATDDDSVSIQTGQKKNNASAYNFSLTPGDFLIKYDKYSFNSSFKALYDVRYVSRSETETVNGSTVPSTNPGIQMITTGEIVGASIDSERVELSYFFNKEKHKYFGLFHSILEKPWSDTQSTWTNGTNEVAYVYKDAQFTSTGITYGIYKTDKELKSNKLTISNFHIDIGTLDISLTDNYNLTDKLQTSTSATYKVSMGGELAYKFPTKALSKGSYLKLSAYGNYDYYYLDTDTTSDADQAVDLSDDFMYGVKATLLF